MEAGRIWGLTNIGCIISLGTGPEGDHTLDNATLEILGSRGMRLCKMMTSRSLYYRLQLAFYSLHAMTGTQHVHDNITEMVEVFGEKHLKEAKEADVASQVYFRLNVTNKEAKVGLDAWSKMGDLKILADKYIKDIAGVTRKAIAKKLATDSKKPPTPPQTGDHKYRARVTVFNDEHTHVSRKQVQALVDTSAENSFVSSELVLELDIRQQLVMAHEKPKFRSMSPSGQLITPDYVVQLVYFGEDFSQSFKNSFFVLNKEHLGEDMIAGSKLALGDGGHRQIMLKPTPLALAAGRGDEATVKQLLENGVNIDSKDKEGFTPLMFAIEENHENVVQMLLEKGADFESGWIWVYATNACHL
ncbi:hypothetical protein GGI43DRAFT_48948 [Trichoderma evansii]